MGEAHIIAPGETAYPLSLAVSDNGSGGVTGLTPTLEIRDGSTAGSYLDFNDNTFKTSAWTTKTANLTEIGVTGRYQYILNASLVAAMADGFIAVAEYKITGGYAAIDSDTLIFRDKISTSVTGNVGGNVTGSVGSVTGNVSGNIIGSVASVSGNVGGNVVGSVASVSGNVGGSVASVVGNVGGNLTGSIGSLASQAKADVNAEADTALADVGVTTTVTGRIDTTISSRVAASFFTGITSLANWLRAIMRSTHIDPTTATEINGDTGTGTGSYSAANSSLEALRARGDSAWTPDPTAGTGDGSVTVGTDYGGTDNLRVLDSLGDPVDNATIVAYLKADWDAGNQGDAYRVAQTTSAVDGRLALPLQLDPETYTLFCYKEGSISTTQEITVT